MLFLNIIKMIRYFKRLLKFRQKKKPESLYDPGCVQKMKKEVSV